MRQWIWSGRAIFIGGSFIVCWIIFQSDNWTCGHQFSQTVIGNIKNFHLAIHMFIGINPKCKKEMNKNKKTFIHPEGVRNLSMARDAWTAVILFWNESTLIFTCRKHIHHIVDVTDSNMHVILFKAVRLLWISWSWRYHVSFGTRSPQTCIKR